MRPPAARTTAEDAAGTYTCARSMSGASSDVTIVIEPASVEAEAATAIGPEARLQQAYDARPECDDEVCRLLEEHAAQLHLDCVLELLCAACKDRRVKIVETSYSIALAQRYDPSSYRKGWSLIHCASQNGLVEAVDLLLQKDNVSPSIKTEAEELTPLHISCREGKDEVTELLLRHPQCQVDAEDKDGNTPLHYVSCNSVCAARAILGVSSSSAYSTNVSGYTPLGKAVSNSNWEIAQQIVRCSTGNPLEKFRDLQLLLSEADRHLLGQPCHEPLKVFVLGDGGCGKSTLIKSLQAAGFLERFMGIFFSTTGVDRHRAGIIPTEFYSPDLGQVVFYDMAGHRDYIHEAIADCTDMKSIAAALFIVVVDMREKKKVIAKKILYWSNFILQQQQQSHCPSNHPRIIVVGSFNTPKAFRRIPTERMKLVMSKVSEWEELYEKFHWLGSYTLDCRKAFSWGINQVRYLLEDQCSEHQNTIRNTSHPTSLYVLNAIVSSSEFKDCMALPFHQLCSEVAASSNPLCKMLPGDKETLLGLCGMLHSFNRLLLLGEWSQEEQGACWVVINYQQLLHRIVDALFVSKSVPASNYGLVTHADFLESGLVIDHDDPGFRDLVLKVLEHYKFCEPWPTKDPVVDPRSLLFFPCLFSRAPHSESWDPEDELYGFKVVWSIIPSSNHQAVYQFFIPRYVYTLLVDLIQKFVPSDLNGKKCKVWSTGICWSDPNGFDIYVSIHDNSAVTLNMRCLKGKEIQMLRCRNQIVRDIHTLKNLIHPQIEVEDYLINFRGAALPVCNPLARELNSALYSLRDIGNSRNQCVVLNHSEGRNPVTLNDLLYFDPVMNVSASTLGDLQNQETASEEISELFCDQFAQAIGLHWKDLAQVFGVSADVTERIDELNAPNNDKAMRLLVKLRESYNSLLTYSELYRALKSISVFLI